jgi:hypothetical protein
MKRCSRQKWLTKAQQDKADAVVTSPTALSAPVRNGADVLSETLADMMRETRHHIARATLESVRRVKRVKVTTMRDIRDATATIESVNPQREGQGTLTLNVLNVSGDLMLGHSRPTDSR